MIWERSCQSFPLQRQFAGKPVCIIAHTVKGKGISFIEHNNKWHAKVCTEEEYRQAMTELDAQEQPLTAAKCEGRLRYETV